MKSISIGGGIAISIVGVGNRGSISSMIGGQVLSISLRLSFGLTLSISKSGVSIVTETISIGGGIAVSIVGVSNRGGVSSTVCCQVLSISLRLSFGLTLAISESGVSVVTDIISVGRRVAISIVGVSNRGGVSSTVGCQVLRVSFGLWLSFSLTLAISMRIGGVGISVAMRDTVAIG